MNGEYCSEIIFTQLLITDSSLFTELFTDSTDTVMYSKDTKRAK
jgi:hypothetical protein